MSTLGEHEIPKENSFLQTALRIRQQSRYNGPVGQTLYTFADESIRRLEEAMKNLSSTNGVEMDRADVTLITQLCFRFGGKYDGTDTHTASEFLRVYPDYLNFHLENLNNNPGDQNRGSRILITTRARCRPSVKLYVRLSVVQPVQQEEKSHFFFSVNVII
jgi:hypothetical protein